MDIFERDGGTTTSETVHRREEFRQIVADVQDLPETQRTALLLREIDALSYDQISEAMDTTVPSVKSLLVRARVSLAEASEARLLTCEEVRLELGQVAEGLAKSSPPVRRHLKTCERCRTFKTELRSTSKALAAIFPVGPLVILQKFGMAKLGLGGGAAASGAAAAGGGGATAGGAGVAAGASVAASERRRRRHLGGHRHARLEGHRGHGRRRDRHRGRRRGQARHQARPRARPPPPLPSLPLAPPRRGPGGSGQGPAGKEAREGQGRDQARAAARTPRPRARGRRPGACARPRAGAPPVQEEEATTTLPPRTEPVDTPPAGEDPGTAPGEPTGAPEQPPAPPAGEPQPGSGQQQPPPPPPAP